MLENIRLAFHGILSHKMRSFLTMLGVIIGIASIIAIVSTIKGSNERIMKNVIGAGNNTVEVTLYQGNDKYYMDYGVPKNVFAPTEQMKQEIRDIDCIESSSFYYSRPYVSNVTFGNDSLNADAVSIYGIDNSYFNTLGYQIYKGRGFVAKDYELYANNIILDRNAAETLLSGKNPVGQIIEIKGVPFKIIGVVKESQEFKPEISSYQEYLTYSEEDYGKMFIPDSSWPLLYDYDEPVSCVVKATKTEKMSDAGKKTTDVMNEVILGANSPVKYHAEDLLEQVRQQQQLASGTNMMLIWIASIALLVGGIGVMNIMLVSVTERTSEIGLKKALGAKKKWILMQFLTESAVLTSVGGILGVISGLILAQVISRISHVPVGISIPAIIVAVVFSMFIGIVFGMLPSVRAANLDPIVALRRD